MVFGRGTPWTRLTFIGTNGDDSLSLDYTGLWIGTESRYCARGRLRSSNSLASISPKQTVPSKSTARNSFFDRNLCLFLTNRSDFWSALAAQPPPQLLDPFCKRGVLIDINPLNRSDISSNCKHRYGGSAPKRRLGSRLWLGPLTMQAHGRIVSRKSNFLRRCLLVDLGQFYKPDFE